MIPFHTNHSHKKKSYIIIIMSINIFVVINQINKHKVKIYNNCTYTKIIIKKNLLFKYRKIYVLINITMINLSLDELRLIAKSRNISDNENRSKEDLTKALSEPKSETKSETSTQTPKQILKPETKPEAKPKTKPETKQKPEPKLESKLEPELEIKVNNKKLKKKLRKYFDGL